MPKLTQCDVEERQPPFSWSRFLVPENATIKHAAWHMVWWVFVVRVLFFI
jgi:hypothetical protein